MRKDLIASLTSKVVVGVAATVLAAGSAGAVVATQTISDNDTPPAGTPAEDVLEANDHTKALDHPTAEDTEDEDADDEATAQDDDDEAEDATEHEHPDNFGATVSEMAKNGEIDEPGEIAELAHEKNEERKADAEAHGKSGEHRPDSEDDDED